MQSQISAQIAPIAGTLFYRKGIQMDEIDRALENANVATATLYRDLISKDVVAYLNGAHERAIAALAALIQPDRNLLKQLNDAFENLFEHAKKSEFRKCAFGLEATEHSKTNQLPAVDGHDKVALRFMFRNLSAWVGIRSPNVTACLTMLYYRALAMMTHGGNAKAAGRAGLRAQCAGHW